AQDGGGGMQNGLRPEEETSFRWQCVEQPIGKLLFQRFLEGEPSLAAAGALWAELEAYERCEEQERGRAAQELRGRFFTPGGAQHCGFLSSAVTGAAGEATP
ncbi:RK kinase, partial [Halcyon senegalensis]|nr:RK kinase [Halcyon senegalensis]